jgi:hypothetical protein
MRGHSRTRRRLPAHRSRSTICAATPSHSEALLGAAAVPPSEDARQQMQARQAQQALA